MTSASLPTIDHPTPASPELNSKVLKVLEGYVAELEGGAPANPEELLARHPELAGPLREYLASLEFLHRAALSLHGSDQSRQVASEPTIAEMGTLGDFRIVREIGRGGMGIVYEAEQISLGRRVALKVLPFAGALDAKQLQRFKNEAHAAAHLQHQNIVPVHFVGCERGVHFYAMQFVEGQTLAALIQELRQARAEENRSSEIEDGESQKHVRHSSPMLTGPYTPADQQVTTVNDQTAGTETAPLTPRSSNLDSRSSPFFRTVANLGIQAAEALEHAHQLGVIHRDIKPANLMVDARGNLWITDFGLAHCQGGCELTMSGDLLGTLRYMSPEQALAKRVIVDERTDVYSLGVTLYELLTLEPAFPGTDRQEVLRQIAFDDPKPPRRLNKAIPAELETIVLKAMEKSPADRFATAQELADDLRRYLDNKPIRARRPTALARLRKWCYRHRGPVSAGVASALLVLAVTSGLTFWQWRVAVGAETLSEERRGDAEKAANTWQAINRFLINDLLSAATPEVARGHKVTAEEVLNKAEAKIDNAFPDQPLVEAGVRMALASAYSSLALYDKAEPHLQRALAIRMQVLGEEDRDTLETLKEMASHFLDQNKYREAEQLCLQTLATARRVLGDDDKLTLKLEHFIARALMEQDRLDEAEPMLRRCLESEMRILSEDNPDTLDTMLTLALLLGERRGQWQEAKRLGERCVELRELTLGKDHLDTLDARNTFADAVLRTEGRFLEAERMHRETLEIARRVLGPDHDMTLTLEHNLAIVLLTLDHVEEAEELWRKCVAGRTSVLGAENAEVLRSRKFLAEALLARGKLDEAEREFGEILELNRRVQGEDERNTLSIQTGIAKVQRAKGRYRQSEETLRQALKICRQRHGPDDPITLGLTWDLANVLEEVGKHEEAGPALRHILQTWRKTSPPGHPSLAYALVAWAEHLLVDGNVQEAEPALEEALRIERAALPPEHRALGIALAAHGWLLARSGRAQQGELLLRQALDICRRAWPAVTWVPADCESRLGDCLTALRQFTEAESMLLSGYQGLESRPWTPPRRRVEAVQRLVKLYETWGKPDKAAEWRAKVPKPAEIEDKNHHKDAKDTKKRP